MQEIVGAGPAGVLERYASPVLLGVTRLDNCYRGLVLITPSKLAGPVRLRSNQHSTLDPGPWSDVEARLVRLLTSLNFIAIP